MDSCGFYSDDCLDHVDREVIQFEVNNNTTTWEDNINIKGELKNNPIIRNKYSLTPDMALG